MKTCNEKYTGKQAELGMAGSSESIHLWVLTFDITIFYAYQPKYITDHGFKEGMGLTLFEPTKQRDIGNFRLLNTAKLACTALDLIRTKSFSWNYSSFDHFFKAFGDYDIDETM